MCIISVFTKENGDFIITQNRDESYLRPTSLLAKENRIYNTTYFGPIDNVSGGTWIYYSHQFIGCVLNGGYKKHVPNPPYRMSRGLVILELLKFTSIKEFIQKIDLSEIEPFTFLLIDRLSTEKFFLIWDGKTKHVENVSNEKLIVRSSSPLYSETEKKFHKKQFQSLQTKTPKEIYDLHIKLKMNPNKKFLTVQSTSITQIISINKDIELKYCPII